MKLSSKKLGQAFLCAIAALSLNLQAEINDSIDRVFDFSDNGKIELSNINGDVTITACSCNQVTLNAQIIASSQEVRDRISIEIDDSSDLISIQTRYKKQNRKSYSNRQFSKVTYTLEVPENTNLKSMELVNGNLSIEGVSGQLKAELVNGALISDGLTSNTKVSLVNGDLTLKFAHLDNAESVDLESVNGKIKVYLPASADVNVNAETVSGKISNDFGFEVIKHKYVGREMHGSLGNGRVKLSMENVNGSIQLKSL